MRARGGRGREKGRDHGEHSEADGVLRALELGQGDPDVLLALSLEQADRLVLALGLVVPLLLLALGGPRVFAEQRLHLTLVERELRDAGLAAHRHPDAVAQPHRRHLFPVQHLEN